jgi:heme-degrading monooxygenase HmoA
MHARVAEFDNPRLSDPSLVDELSSRARESAPQWRQALPDAQGHLMLIDRENGRGLGVTLFGNEEQIREAEPVFERMGDEIPEETRGRRTSVSVYEVVLQEVETGARAARVSRVDGDPKRVDEATRESRETILPRAREMPGWKGILSLADRKTGRAVLITLWDSQESMQASEQRADELRRASTEAGGGTIAGVERYEVAMAENLAEAGAPR